MNILHRFTRQTLSANRSQTLVTIIGIVLSMALVTAIIEGAYSGQQFLVRCVEEMEGRWHIYESELTQEDADSIRRTDGVSESAVWHELGWAEIGSKNSEKPYLLIEAADENIQNLLSIRLLSGRMPENDNELLLPNNLASSGGVLFHTGDTLTLSLGRRVDEAGKRLPASQSLQNEIEECITDTVERSFTVVGTYERLPYEIDSFSCPGYTAITRGNGSGDLTVFLRLKHPGKMNEWLASHKGSGSRTAHDDLRRLNCGFNGELNDLLYGFAGILVFMVSVGSISLIYNSFSISVSERTRQFGILKSIGATKKQIRSSVMYEALVLCSIGIPIGMLVGCAGIGLTLYFLRDAFAGIVGMHTQMRLVLHPVALLISAAVCTATVLISASTPARRAIRISPIDSIRYSNDIKLKGREVRTSRLTQRLFGFECTMAAKNFKRNRRRYRSTVVSLVLSVSLFISASSFCAYLTDSIQDVSGIDMDRPDITYTCFENEDLDKVLKLLSVEGVTKSIMYDLSNERLFAIPNELVNPHAWKYLLNDQNAIKHDQELSGRIAFVLDDAFRSICYANGYDPTDYFDPAHPLALACDQKTFWVRTASGSKAAKASLLDESKLPCNPQLVTRKEFENYAFSQMERTENGNLYYYYEKDADGSINHEAPRKIFTTEEAELRLPLAIGGIAKKKAFGLASDGFMLLYPYSMKNVFPAEYTSSHIIFGLYADDHAKAYDHMKTALIDAGLNTGTLRDAVAYSETIRMAVNVVNVFAYGFIILISLIAVANVFNTISTSILLRRRELAMLRSVGLGKKGFMRMMNYECIIYGVKGLLFGLPAAIGMTWVIWNISNRAVEQSFYIPWHSIAIAVCSVFLVVFATMLYATAKLKQKNTIDALKNENV